jgi:hypothetical protein
MVSGGGVSVCVAVIVTGGKLSVCVAVIVSGSGVHPVKTTTPDSMIANR